MADRDLPAGLEAALSSEMPELALACYINWPSGAGYFWSGSGSRDYNLQTWTGVGELVEIDKVAESLKSSDIGLELRLNYLDDSIRNEVTTHATEDIVGQDATLYLWHMAAGVVESSKAIFPGFIDSIEIEDQGETGAVIVRIASELARMRRRRSFQLSDAHQKFLFSGDTSMQWAARMDEPVLWGRKPTTPRTRSTSRDPRRYDSSGAPV